MIEDLTGGGYTQRGDAVPMTGTTDTDTVTPQAIAIDGFTAVEPVTQQTIKGDGTTVVEIRYTRNATTDLHDALRLRDSKTIKDY